MLPKGQLLCCSMAKEKTFRKIHTSIKITSHYSSEATTKAQKGYTMCIPFSVVLRSFDQQHVSHLSLGVINCSDNFNRPKKKRIQKKGCKKKICKHYNNNYQKENDNHNKRNNKNTDKQNVDKDDYDDDDDDAGG